MVFSIFVAKREGEDSSCHPTSPFSSLYGCSTILSGTPTTTTWIWPNAPLSLRSSCTAIFNETVFSKHVLKRILKTSLQIQLPRTTQGFKLEAGSGSGRSEESISTEASINKELPGELHRILRTERNSKDSAVVKITFPEFRYGNAHFLVDPFSNSNLIKKGALNPELKFNPQKAVEIAGITDHPFKMIATLKLPILAFPTELHVVKNSIPVTSAGPTSGRSKRETSSKIGN